MDIIKLFVDNVDNIEINIKGTIDEPLFQANQIGELLGLKNIRESIRDFDDSQKVVILTDTQGGNQNVIYLTEIGLYRFLGMSRKEKAKKFQIWIATVIKEIRLKGKYELEKSLKDSLNNLEYQKELSRHLTLIETLKETSGVYVGKIKNVDDDKILIKIGSTINIKDRIISLKKHFGKEFIFLDFFESLRHFDYEKSVLKDSSLTEYQYKEKINDTDYSNETFLIPKSFYDDLITIIKRKQKDFQGKYTNEQIFELEKQKHEIELLKEQQEIELLQIKKLELQQNLELSEMKNKLNKPPPIIIDYKKKITRGNKVQKYSLDGILLETYNGLRDVSRKEELLRINEKTIRNAINYNYTYKNFRWLFLDRDLPDDTIQILPETVEHKINPVDYIVMLDNTKTKIIEIFSNQYEAAQNRKLASTTCIYNSIKKNKECKGHYFCYYNDCPNELKEKYLETNRLPEFKRRFNAIKVNQINPYDDSIVKTFNSYSEIELKFQIGMTKLKEVINNKEIYKGYKWSFINQQ